MGSCISHSSLDRACNSKLTINEVFILKLTPHTPPRRKIPEFVDSAPSAKDLNAPKLNLILNRLYNQRKSLNSVI